MLEAQVVEWNLGVPLRLLTFQSWGHARLSEWELLRDPRRPVSHRDIWSPGPLMGG